MFLWKVGVSGGLPLKGELVLVLEGSTSKSLDGICASLLPRWMEAVKKGKVYENERQILRTHAYVASSPSLVPCREPICLGKPKGDLACRLHWKSNEHSNDGHSLGAIFVL